MNMFNKIFFTGFGLIIYFALLLPWLLSQASDVTVIAGFCSLAAVLYFGTRQIIKLINQL